MSKVRRFGCVVKVRPEKLDIIKSCTLTHGRKLTP